MPNDGTAPGAGPGGAIVPSQDGLDRRWNVDQGAVSKWLRDR